MAQESAGRPIDTGPVGGTPADLMSALVTEHFVLQSAASTTVTEALGRSSLYLATLSSGLIGIGFASQSPDLLQLFALLVLPTVFILGMFTVVRLVDTGAQNIAFLGRIARIRGYYRTLSPTAPAYFGAWGAGDDISQALATQVLAPTPYPGLFTTASMIATVNSVVGALTVGLGIAWLMRAPAWVPVVAAAAVLVACLVGFHRYQDSRYRQLTIAAESVQEQK